jgi:hypothetical protein
MDEIDVGSASPLLVVYLSADRIGITKVRISLVEVPTALREEVTGATRTCDRSSLVNLGDTNPSE